MAQRLGLSDRSLDRACFGGCGRWSFTGRLRLLYYRGIIRFPKRGLDA